MLKSKHMINSTKYIKKLIQNERYDEARWMWWHRMLSSSYICEIHTTLPMLLKFNSSVSEWVNTQRAMEKEPTKKKKKEKRNYGNWEQQAVVVRHTSVAHLIIPSWEQFIWKREMVYTCPVHRLFRWKYIRPNVHAHRTLTFIHLFSSHFT